jgi:parallel beta-helix repeat protein
MKPAPRSVTIAALPLLALAAAASAGPLTPPSGVIQSTMKTLMEVEPRIAINATNTPGDSDSIFRISQPGSYYLTGNVPGAIGESGIEIAASGVTIDLNGFDVAGVTGSLNGVSSSGTLSGVTVKNGTVRGWGASGVALPSVTGVIVRDVIALSNAGSGIVCGASASVSGCVVRQNIAGGILCGERAVVTNCVSTLNGGTGIQVGNASVVSGCSADDNGGEGISVSFLSHASGNTSSRNTRAGILASSSCIVVDNTVSENDLHGIEVASNCLVRGNVLSLNDGAGVSARFGQNRIEGNQAITCGTGFQVSGVRNLIIGNSATLSTVRNYDIASGNRYGPIIDLTASGAAPALGNSALSTLVTTDPNANFAH